MYLCTYLLLNITQKEHLSICIEMKVGVKRSEWKWNEVIRPWFAV
jgi:hypothetical protein